jgi:sugar phosphate permease
MAYALMLGFCLKEPRRARNEDEGEGSNPPGDKESASISDDSGPMFAKIARIVTNPRAALLLAVFVGANFVAATFLSWLPMFVSRKFKLGLGESGLTSTLWPLASLPGALLAGVMADWAIRRWRGGRIGVQAVGLILAAPFVFLTGWSESTQMLSAALVGAGFCKGIYDANIFASLYDVINPEDRGTAAGLMNTVGWTGGLVAPPLIGMASEQFGLGVAITATAAVYLLVGVLALFAARMAGRRSVSV